MTEAKRGPRLGLWAIVWTLVILVVGGFLAFPFQTAPALAWLAPLQAGGREGARQAGPFLLVAAIAGAIGLSEVTSTFSNYPREALLTSWARVLVLVNALAATLAYLIAQIYAPQETNPLLLALGTGVGFQAIIRTRFVLARQFNENGRNEEVSVNLGWLYDQFQALCKTQIDLELMNNRRSAVTRLVQRYPTVQELYGIAAYAIEARATLSAAEQAERRATLDTLASGQAPTDIARAKIALFILETGGQTFVDFLLQQLDEQAARAEGGQTAVPSQAAATDDVVRRLAGQHTLDGLVQLAGQLVPDKTFNDWVEKAAEPAPGVPEAQQKAAIAYRLVREAGLEKVKGAMGEPPVSPGGAG